VALEQLRCPACRLDFPQLADIPWLFADPEATRTEWRNRWHMALAELQQRVDRADSALQKTERASARTRLELLRSGCQQQLQAIRELLEGLELGQPADLTTYLALKTRPPPAAGLFSYDANVFRDWNWGETENSLSCQAVLDTLDDFRPLRALVLGAGAGRLAYDLHQSWHQHRATAASGALTVALDMNPYLSTITRRVTTGEHLTLVEFPRAPVSAEAAAISRTLAAPEPAANGFEVVLADALRPPFRNGVFDLVVTPWLLDVIDVPPAEFVSRLNPLLREGGCWLMHGSLAFEHADPIARPDLEELIEIAVDCGFGEINKHEQRMPYLDCPDSRHARLETVVTLKAAKLREGKQLPKYQSLPDWLARGREPIPLLPAFQTQAMTTRIYAFIMSLIDGNRSLQDIATIMEEQQLMPKADAETAIRGFLIKMFEEALQQRE